jgi:hypothetical protein
MRFSTFLFGDNMIDPDVRGSFSVRAKSENGRLTIQRETIGLACSRKSTMRPAFSKARRFAAPNSYNCKSLPYP